MNREMLKELALKVVKAKRDLARYDRCMTVSWSAKEETELMIVFDIAKMEYDRAVDLLVFLERDE